MTDAAGYWWERRRDAERTAAYLTRVLEELGPGFATVAAQARWCWYDDYFCPESVDDGANMQRLVRDVLAALRGVEDPELRARAVAVGQAVKAGEFDGTREEAREWAASPAGQATFAELLSPRRNTR